MGNTIKVVPTEVKITPGGEITWHATDVDGGRLYTPSIAPAVDDPMLLFRHYLNSAPQWEWIGFGGEGNVHAIGDYALKHYNTPENPQYHPFENYGSISDLRANVALAEGLKRIEQPSAINYDIRGVEIHAVYVPETPYISEKSVAQTQALWLMERLYDSHYAVGEQLNAQERTQLRRLYDAALNLYDIPDYAVEYDDQRGTGNTMITDMPTSTTRGQMVKYDSYALENWLDY
jgi:hypothetical protein